MNLGAAPRAVQADGAVELADVPVEGRGGEIVLPTSPC
jgi:hypothetical protein